MQLVLTGIPVRRNVRVSGAEDDENVIAVPELLPQGIRAGYMREERALLRVQFERQMIRVQAVRSMGHQRTQRILADDAIQLFDTCFFEMLWHVHGASPEPELGL